MLLSFQIELQKTSISLNDRKKTELNCYNQSLLQWKSRVTTPAH